MTDTVGQEALRLADDDLCEWAIRWGFGNWPAIHIRAALNTALRASAPDEGTRTVTGPEWDARVLAGALAEIERLAHAVLEAPASAPSPAAATACPDGFSRVTPEAKAELRDFAEWLKLPKPKPEFHAWRAAQGEVEP